MNKAPSNVQERGATRMESHRADRRVQRTEDLLRQALRTLIQEKRFSEITVQNVIDRADVGRSTFYAHYRGKEDLFRSDVERFLGFIERGVTWKGGPKERIVPVRELFDHVREFRAFCRALSASGKMEALQRAMASHLASHLEKRLAIRMSPSQRQAVPVSILANHIAGSLVTMLDWWFRNGMSQTPERMDQIFHALVMPSVRSVTGRGLDRDTGRATSGQKLSGDP